MDNQPTNPNEAFVTETVLPPKKSVGPVVGLVIVIVLIILGGIYFWMQKTDEYVPVETDADTEALKQQGTSDEISALEADINATNLDNLDKELNQIDAEINAQ